MSLRIRHIVKFAAGIVVLSLLAVVSPVSAQDVAAPGDPTPLTFSGRITHFGTPVVGHTVVVWCSPDLDKFGGSGNTDANGFFEIRTTNGENCLLGNHGFLEVFRDGDVVGFSGYVTIHTQNTVNIKLEGGNPISVPEFERAGSAAALAAAGGFIALARRRFAR